jgi:hypothetical protein
MSELDTYGSVGVLSGNRPFYPDKFTPFTLDCWKATNHKLQPIDYSNYI